MGRPVVDKTGQRFGKLTVVELLPRKMRAPVMFRCVCDCGGSKDVESLHLGNGVASCGCLVGEVRRTRHVVPLEHRFWEKVALTDDPGKCWNWTGAIDPDTGYGRIGIRGTRTGNAHKVSYLLHYEFLGDGMLVCHTCDNRRCVNPQHLYPGTYSDNINDAWARTRRKTQ